LNKKKKEMYMKAIKRKEEKWKQEERNKGKK